MRVKQCMGLMCLWLCFNWMAQAQVITVENGFSISKVKDMYADKNLLPYQMSAGLDYLDHGWFQLSSQIGFLKKGGKSDYVAIHEESMYGGKERSRLHVRYLTFNTTFNLKTRSQSGWVWFAGIGPRLDVYLSNTHYLDTNVKENGRPLSGSLDGACPVVVGLKCVAGLERDYGRVRIGFRAAYLPSFTHTFENDTYGPKHSFSYSDQTFTVGVSFGYILKGKRPFYTVRRTKTEQTY